MPANISKSYGVVTPAQIDAFEQRNNLRLPQDYRDFLLASNGGEPLPDVLDVPGWHGQSTILARFFGLHNGPYANLERTLQGSVDVLPPGFLAIAEDAGGNLLCLGLKGDYLGKIFFWDHEDSLDDDGESKLDMSNMFLVANGINNLLDELHEI